MTAVAVRVAGRPTCLLTFDATDLVASRPDSTTTTTTTSAAVRVSVAASTVAAVACGAISGSAAAMSGQVSIAGDPSVLRGLARIATGPRFRSYLGCVTEPAGRGPELVAVLGAPNDADGGLSPMAMQRCAAAARLCRGSPPADLVLCGGFGAHFNTTDQPHWRHCAAWLARYHHGPPPRVVGGIESRHTYDDVLLLRELTRALRPRGVTVVTSDYHGDRARFLVDLVLPGAAVRTVTHDGLGIDELERLRRHERDALARTVAASLIFGVDRLPGPVTRASEEDRLILRLAAA